MNTEHGNLTMNSENMFPIIKKWLYSDHDIFFREMISNGCDAITKLKKLELMGETSLDPEQELHIDVVADSSNKILSFSDNGLGMTAEEVKKYINDIAFSGASDFLNTYKDKANEDQIIGHFGLGFYSAFMVADKVTIDTLSWQDGAEPVHWESEGGVSFSLEAGDRTQRGTTVTLYLSDDSTEFCNEWRAREVLQKYCAFMPYPIYLTNPDKKPEEPKTVRNEDGSETVQEPEAPKPLNDTEPLWQKTPSACTDEEYKAFYRKVFNDWKEPLFWIHLNMDYPFNLKGILYFPKINIEYESIEGKIKLYNNQVFIADNIKEVIPEFLMLLKGVIDCPDLPLNVSRSALQNDGFVQKISEYITKKVADKLSGMCKTDRENYEKYWDDISPFIKYGCLRDEKFCQKMTDYILFRDLDGKYHATPEALEVNCVDPDAEKPEGEKPEGEKAVDENGAPVEAEVVDDQEKAAEETPEEEQEKDHTIYYVTDEQQQSQYINMFRQAKMQAFVLNQNIDQPFISQLEAKNEGLHFARIDADVTEALKSRTGKKAAEELKKQEESLSESVKKTLKDEQITVSLQKLKDKKIAALLTVNEQSRRMADMMKMYAANGMDLGAFGKEGRTLVLNANHPLVKYLLEHQEEEKAGLVLEQLYDLAKLQNAPLEADEMTRFVERSNKVLLMMTEEA
ncbi:MAG: molecular chaperone HtpG [Oscillospiraceae bacterium]|nr:molecular chaperone HtpG [Oscillospiraceae bacterium]